MSIAAMYACTCTSEGEGHEPGCPAPGVELEVAAFERDRAADVRELAELEAREQLARTAEPEPVVPEPEPVAVPAPVVRAPPASDIPARPPKPQPGVQYQYVIRWQREGRPEKRKTYLRWAPAVAQKARLELEKTEPGTSFRTKKGRRMQNSRVIWTTFSIEEVQAYGEAYGRDCPCCGERFIPTREQQQYLDQSHKQRAYRQRVTAVA